MRAMADAGMTHAKDFRDPARALLSRRWSLLFRLMERRARHPARAGLEAGDTMALRTMILDAHLVEALDRGAKQLVILGAGSDGRAFRLPGLTDVHVFEVDHPATQAFKRRASAPLAHSASQLDFVAVDFERQSLDLEFERAGAEILSDSGCSDWAQRFGCPPPLTGTARSTRAVVARFG